MLCSLIWLSTSFIYHVQLLQQQPQPSHSRGNRNGSSRSSNSSGQTRTFCSRFTTASSRSKLYFLSPTNAKVMFSTSARKAKHFSQHFRPGVSSIFILYCCVVFGFLTMSVVATVETLFLFVWFEKISISNRPTLGAQIAVFGDDLYSIAFIMILSLVINCRIYGISFLYILNNPRI